MKFQPIKKPITMKQAYLNYFAIQGHLIKARDLIEQMQTEWSTNNYEIDLALVASIANKYQVLTADTSEEFNSYLDLADKCLIEKDYKRYVEHLIMMGFTDNEARNMKKRAQDNGKMGNLLNLGFTREEANKHLNEDKNGGQDN